MDSSEVYWFLYMLAVLFHALLAMYLLHSYVQACAYGSRQNLFMS